MGEHVAARDIDLAAEDERYGLSGGFGKIAVHGDDARDRGGLAGGCDPNLVTHPDRDRGTSSGSRSAAMPCCTAS